MATQQQTWKDLQQKRFRRTLSGTAIIIILAAVLITAFSVIGAYLPAIGSAFFASVSLFIAFLAYYKPIRAAKDSADPLQSIQVPPTAPVVVPPQLPSDSNSAELPRRYPDPFKGLGPLKSEQDFYGREKERYALEHGAENQESTSLVGQHRIGKSWLMQYLALVASRTLGANYVAIELSVESPSAFGSVAGFVETVLGKLKDKIQAGTACHALLEKALVELQAGRANPWTTIQNQLAILERTIEKISKESIVTIVCIDEFDLIAEPDVKKEFGFAFFRCLRTMATTSGENFIMVTASRDSLRKIVGRVGRASGFSNIFNQIRILTFDRRAAIDFVQTKGDQARFATFAEFELLFRIGGEGWWLWRRYWPFRLEQAGSLMCRDREFANRGQDDYEPEHARYRRKLLQELAGKDPRRDNRKGRI